MLPRIRDLSVTTNKNERRITPSNQRQLKPSTNQKLITPRLRFGETVDARAYSIEDPQIKHSTDSTTQCNGTVTEDWLRRQAIATIKRHIAKNEQPKEYPAGIENSNDQYMTTKRKLPQSDQERIYVYDKDYICDPWDRPDIYDQSSLTSKKNNPLQHLRNKTQATTTNNHCNNSLRKILTAPPRHLFSQTNSPSHSTQFKST